MEHFWLQILYFYTKKLPQDGKLFVGLKFTGHVPPPQ